MFRRRNVPSLGRRVFNAIWPSIGWRRAFAYFWHRVARIPDTSYRIAAGFACGAAISFTPLVGTHFLLSALMAWVLRANVVAALIGTVVGNPWTFPFIWIWIYKVGIWLGAGQLQNGAEDVDFTGLFADMVEAALRFDLHYLVNHVWPVWWPMMVGSVPTLIIVWFAFYFPMNAMVAAYQRQRRQRLQRKHARRNSTVPVHERSEPS